MKNSKKLFVSFLLLLYLSSCKSPHTSLYQFDPRIIGQNEIKLSEIADNITYIPLDNNFNLGLIYENIQFINDSIYLSAKDIGILVFNKEGRTLRKIGNIGRGPGEYVYNYSYTVDDKKGTVYVMDRKMIKVYSKTGNFLRSISLQEYGGSIDKIVSYNSELFLSYMLQLSDPKYDWIILDTLGNLIKKKERTIPTFISNWGEGGGTYIFDYKMSYWNQYADTVFSIFPDLNEKPSLIFSTGEHRLPMSNIADPGQLKQYMSIFQIFESNRFLAIRYYYKRQIFVLIDKMNRRSFISYLESESSISGSKTFGGIENNLDGGIRFLPSNYFVENGREYLVSLIDPYQIKECIATIEFKNSTPKYPEKKKELEKLANVIKETDNPVLMLVRLKK